MRVLFPQKITILVVSFFHSRFSFLLLSFFCLCRKPLELTPTPVRASDRWCVCSHVVVWWSRFWTSVFNSLKSESRWTPFLREFVCQRNNPCYQSYPGFCVSSISSRQLTVNYCRQLVTLHHSSGASVCKHALTSLCHGHDDVFDQVIDERALQLGHLRIVAIHERCALWRVNTVCKHVWKNINSPSARHVSWIVFCKRGVIFENGSLQVCTSYPT